jgi:hypothetical protein
MRTLAAAVIIGIASMAWADQEHCPMASSQEHRAAVDHRHHDATGVGDDASEHHFVLAKDGGSIRLEVRDSTEVAARDRIRKHLQEIAQAFGAGDFSMPMRIHDRVPPGADVMTERSSAIRYSYAATDKGGVVTISTEDATAREAIHRFLRFQISDHGTGDPTE